VPQSGRGSLVTRGKENGGERQLSFLGTRRSALRREKRDARPVGLVGTPWQAASGGGKRLVVPSQRRSQHDSPWHTQSRVDVLDEKWACVNMFEF
jgi:hypothetical protein